MSNLGSSYGGASIATQANTAMPNVPTEKAQFEMFVKNELKYHKAMAEMYEHLLANSLLANEDNGAAEMLRTLLVAGMHKLADAK